MIDKMLCADCLTAYLGAPVNADPAVEDLCDGAVTIFEGAAVCLPHFRARHGVA